MNNIEAELFKQGKYDELWERCCGFIDLNLEDFMKIQRRLLLEQLVLQKNCRLGRDIMGGAAPRNVDQFRQWVPLTSYADYEHYLLTQDEDALPEKPVLWQYTSGRYGEYPFLWAPVTRRQLREIEPLIFALLFLSTGKQRREITLKERDKVLYGMAPPPYATGSMVRAFPHHIFNFLPPMETAEQMSFEERIQHGFELALSEGMDLCFALSSVTVAIGNRFSERSGKVDMRALIARPKALLRLARGLIRSKIARRPMLPRDLWTPKGLITVGIDSSVFKEKIKNMWGRYPLDIYGCTEAVLIATQTWDYEGMTLIPHLNFFEFIPEEESIKSRDDPTYKPLTVLLNEVKPGENYELVITSFHGGPFIRYKTGHLIKIMSLRNEEYKINTPQITFLSRIDDMIDIAGFTRLTEKIIWQAIVNTGIAHNGWTVRKEISEKPILHLYIELKNVDGMDKSKVKAAVDEELRKLDEPYAELRSMVGLQPLEVTLLPSGAFEEYTRKQRAARANLAHLKPPHINPPDSVLDLLINSSGKINRVGDKVEH